MVNYERSRLDAVFAALADPTRRAILARLARREASVSELARPFRMSLPGVHKHLRVLERAGLLTQTKRGRVRRCRLQANAMRNAARWIERYRRFWEQQFDALATYLEATEPKETASWPPLPPPPDPAPSRSSSGARSAPPGSGSSVRGRRRKS
jgi:DNA-binding transcriptional ArsR family regulator